MHDPKFVDAVARWVHEKDDEGDPDLVDSADNLIWVDGRLCSNGLPPRWSVRNRLSVYERVVIEHGIDALRKDLDKHRPQRPPRRPTVRDVAEEVLFRYDQSQRRKRRLKKLAKQQISAEEKRIADERARVLKESANAARELSSYVARVEADLTHALWVGCLLDHRAAKLAEMNAIFELSRKEGRLRTPEEKARFDVLMSEVMEVDRILEPHNS